MDEVTVTSQFLSVLDSVDGVLLEIVPDPFDCSFGTEARMLRYSLFNELSARFSDLLVRFRAIVDELMAQVGEETNFSSSLLTSLLDFFLNFQFPLLWRDRSLGCLVSRFLR